MGESLHNPYRNRSEFQETGRTHEYMLLGVVYVSPEKLQEILIKLTGSPAMPKYLDWKKSVQLVRECQSGDPENPSKPFLKDLMIEVEDKLIDLDSNANVKAFTALSTPLDYLHGVDAFLVATINGQEFICTIDVTLSKSKVKQGHKADVIVGRVPDPTVSEEQQDSYLREIEQIADQVIKSLLDKIEAKKPKRKPLNKFSIDAA